MFYDIILIEVVTINKHITLKLNNHIPPITSVEERRERIRFDVYLKNDVIGTISLFTDSINFYLKLNFEDILTVEDINDVIKLFLYNVAPSVKDRLFIDTTENTQEWVADVIQSHHFKLVKTNLYQRKSRS